MRFACLVPIAIVGAVIVSPAQSGDTTISGFVDAALTYHTSDTNGEFGLDQVEIDIDHMASENTSLRADLEWVRDGEMYVADVEQGYVAYTGPYGCTFTLGKFNAPIGFELLDPTDVYQYSHALVFDHGLPTNLTGASLFRAFGPGLDVIVHVSNGWDRSTSNKNLTGGGRVGYTRDGLVLGVSAISGKEQPIPEDDEDVMAFTRTVFDVDASVTHDRWLFGGEVNLGSVEMGDMDADWMGFLIMAHVELTNRLGLTGRFDHFDDSDGYVFGLVGDEPQVRQAITIAPTAVLDDGFGALAELRIDMSDQEAFVDGDGDPTDTSTTVAFEMTYSW